MLDLFFYALCAALIGFAGITVAARDLFRSALALLGVLLCTAVLFVLLKAELVALAQVMVYVGGIMIFVLYAVLLTSELGGRMPSPSWLKIGLAAVTGAAALGVLARLALQAGSGSVGAGPGTPAIADMKSLGAHLLDPDGFLVPFELISVLLLAAMVGAIAIAREGSASDRKPGARTRAPAGVGGPAGPGKDGPP